MNMSNNSNWGGNLVFFLLGAATGAAVALLYAPQEGEATRRLIGEKAGDIKDKATEYSSTVAQTAKDKWGNIADTVTSKAQDLSNKAQDVLKRGQGAAHNAIDSAAEKAHSTVDTVS
jgi:gas vesicle protein